MRNVSILCVAFLAAVLCAFPHTAGAQSYESLWREVNKASEKNLPQTVLKLTRQIYDQAQALRNVPQMLKASLCGNAYEESLTPDSLYAHLRELEAWAAAETVPTDRAILHVLLMREYAEYAGSNYGALRSRTAMDIAPDEAPADVREWSIVQFAQCIDRHARLALAEPATLAAQDTRSYVPLVEQGKESSYYDHDLLHVVARTAIEAYRNVGGLMERDSVDARLDAIYNKVLDTYRQMPDRADALLLVMLDYEDWKENVPAIDSLIARHADRPLCAEAYLRKARRLCEPNKERRGEALALLDEGIRRYPRYRRINALKEYRANLLMPELAVTTIAFSYPGSKQVLHLAYRNLKGFTLKIYQTVNPDAEKLTPYNHEYAFEAPLGKLVSSRHYDLPQTLQPGVTAENAPYAYHRVKETFEVPETVGTYLMQIVPDAPIASELKYQRRTLSVSRLMVQTLPLGNYEAKLYTLDARTGKPVGGATVSLYFRAHGKEKAGWRNYPTDAEGAVTIKTDRWVEYYRATTDTDQTMMPQRAYWNGVQASSDEERTVTRLTLLTDRGLYRPGQTVYIKGVAYDQKGADARVCANKKYTLSLRDANRKEIATREVTTGDMGSFSTEFVLPSACLNGQFSIASSDASNVYFRVEEYKRPTFEVKLNAISEAYALGDTVRLTGCVTSFSGAAVQRVPIAFRVQHAVDLRYSVNYRSLNAPATPMVADTVLTDADGRFTLSFKLDSLNNGRIWHRGYGNNFEVTASATSEAGETVTDTYRFAATSRRYNYNLQCASILCKDKALPVKASVSNFAGQWLDVEGTFRLIDLSTDRQVLEDTFRSNRPIHTDSWCSLPSGSYRMEICAKGDTLSQGFGQTAEFTLFSKSDRVSPAGNPLFVYTENDTVQAGKPAVLYVGSSLPDTYMRVHLFGKQGLIRTLTLQPDSTLQRLELNFPDTDSRQMRVHVGFVKDGQAYQQWTDFRRPAPDRTLRLTWSTFRDRLRPGQHETWTLRLATPQGTPADAEVLALMYDASLDKLYKTYQALQVYYRHSLPHYQMLWSDRGNHHFSPGFKRPHFAVDSWWRYDRLYNPFAGSRAEVLKIVEHSVVAPNVKMRSAGKAMNDAAVAEDADAVEVKYTNAQAAPESAELAEPEVGIDPAGLRSNFSETAFFYPQLRTNEQGEVLLQFEMPHSLTRWNFRAIGHTADMLTGDLSAEVITQKDFMLTPNVPRFVRVGDKVRIGAILANLTPKAIAGEARMELFDPATERVLRSQKVKFGVEANATTALHFGFEATDKQSLIGIRMVAEGGSFSDGEQHLLPVLTDKQYITETVALSVRNGQTATYSLDSLFNRNAPSATDRCLTLELTGNPAWLAVQALPTLSLPTTDNAIAWASAFYANTLAAHIAASQPRIRTLIESWQAAGGTGETLLSQLEKNEELKTVLLNESPWLMEATNESEQRRRLATLFDLNTQANRRQSALAKLAQLQDGEGAWCWYKGMPGSRFVTTYIVQQLVRLQCLAGAEVLDGEALQMKRRALDYLQAQARREYTELRKLEKKGTKADLPSEAAFDYLYLLAMDGTLGKALHDNDKAEVVRYFLQKVPALIDSRAMTTLSRAAVVLHAAGKEQQAAGFVASLREHLVSTPEQGAHFAFNEGVSFYGMGRESVHVAAMEALRRVRPVGADSLLSEMSCWLLKQKQTRAWRSPVATVNAVYALFDADPSQIDADRSEAIVRLGKHTYNTLTDGTPGMGYLKRSFAEGTSEVKARRIEVSKPGGGMAWGALYATSFMPIADVRTAGSQLQVAHQLFVERVDATGRRTLQPLADGTARLRVGDKVVSRLTLRTDRALDFVHLKVSRGACFEPMGALSGYRWGADTGYYLEEEDASTNYFFDRLSSGVYVLEHYCRVARAGEYQTGLATLQSVYAPEFSAHAAGLRVVVE